jgi:hypothetical protein
LQRRIEMIPLQIRVTHGAFNSPEELAAELLRLANLLQVSTICTVNRKVEMYAVPGTTLETVMGMYRNELWKFDRGIKPYLGASPDNTSTKK